MSVEQIKGLEYEALQAEKRDIIGRRIQIWNIFFGLVGATGFAGFQGGNISLLLVLYPFLAFCLARYTAHSNRVLKQVKQRLFDLEEESDYEGYEHLNRLMTKFRKSGSHAKALRDALVLTQIAATVLAAMLFPAFHFMIAGAETAITIATFACLTQ